MGTKTRNFIFGTGVGMLSGLGMVIGLQNIKSPARTARFIEEENMPKIMKVYCNHLMAKDQILVENPENPGHYVPLSVYLKYKSKLEEEKIENLFLQKEYQNRK